MAPVSQAATPVPVLVVSILLAASCAAASFPWLTRAIGPGPRVNRPGSRPASRDGADGDAVRDAATIIAEQARPEEVTRRYRFRFESAAASQDAPKIAGPAEQHRADAPARPRRAPPDAPRPHPGPDGHGRTPGRGLPHLPLPERASQEAPRRRRRGSSSCRNPCRRHDAGQGGPWKDRALNAEDALKAAYAEISSQRDQIGKLLGRIRDLEIDLPADAVERINAENRTLRLQNRKLTTDNQQLTERIKAARENNRFLDTRIARLEADLAESLLAGQRAPAQPS